jgi:hypothetical protein
MPRQPKDPIPDASGTIKAIPRQWLVKQIRATLLEEFEAKVQDLNLPSNFDHIQEIFSEHRQKIRNLTTYEELDTFFHIYLRMSLQEWLDSMP